MLYLQLRDRFKMRECIYCELGIHGNCQMGECTCPCEGDRNKFIKQQDSE